MTPTYTEVRSHVSRAQAGLDCLGSFRNGAHEQNVRLMLDDHLPSCDAALITVSSHDGVVRLDGTVSDGNWLAGFKNQVMAAFPSVTIDDRLDWVVPDCGIGYV